MTTVTLKNVEVETADNRNLSVNCRVNTKTSRVKLLSAYDLDNHDTVDLSEVALDAEVLMEILFQAAFKFQDDKRFARDVASKY